MARVRVRMELYSPLWLISNAISTLIDNISREMGERRTRLTNEGFHFSSGKLLANIHLVTTDILNRF